MVIPHWPKNESIKIVSFHYYLQTALVPAPGHKEVRVMKRDIVSKTDLVVILTYHYCSNVLATTTPFHFSLLLSGLTEGANDEDSRFVLQYRYE
jgi:hypothetical protein